MPFRTFLAYTAAGSAVWIALLAGAGYLLQENYEPWSTG
jgi:membrane protein DedA with SNARE-associated domain